MPRGIGRAKPKDAGYDVGQGDYVEVIKISPKAVQVRMPDNDAVWFPFSQIHPDSDICESNCALEHEGTLLVTTWIAGQKGLLDGGDGF